ncbi:MAG: hypothetical protein ACRD1U_00970 [Vicinamibacterales bacterium]
MTERQAETLADILIGVAAASAVYYVLKSPEARRTLWQAARGAFAASGPWLVSEIRQGWAASGRTRGESSTAPSPVPRTHAV